MTLDNRMVVILYGFFSLTALCGMALSAKTFYGIFRTVKTKEEAALAAIVGCFFFFVFACAYGAGLYEIISIR